MNIEKWKMLAVSMTLVCCLAIPVLAYTYLYRTPLYSVNPGITLLAPPTPTMQLGFYYDFDCTLPVTTIDFGEIAFSTSPTTIMEVIYVRNEGSNATTIFWNSTLSATTTAITDDWYFSAPVHIPLNSTILEPNTKLTTNYEILIQASPPPGTYNWTLTVWGECYL